MHRISTTFHLPISDQISIVFTATNPYSGSKTFISKHCQSVVQFVNENKEQLLTLTCSDSTSLRGIEAKFKEMAEYAEQVENLKSFN
jgi:hypothetical protein